MRKKILEILNNEKASIFERYVSVYRELLSSDKQNNYLLLKDIIEISAKIDFPKNINVNISPDVLAISKQYSKFIKEMVISLSRQNLIPEEFYEKLYENVFESSIFPEKDFDRGIILYILADKTWGLPYYQAKDVAKIEQDEFSAIANGEIKDEITKALFMTKYRFDTWPEVTAQLCDIADTLKDEKQKAVFWACILQNYRQKDDSNKN